MRIPSALVVGRYAVAFTLVAGSMFLLSAEKKAGFTKHDKAYYADASTVNFVRPGLNITIVSAKIASDGTISVDYKLADPKGLPLDAAGIQTPGSISPRFLAAYIPNGQSQFVSYITTTATAVVGGKTATQASGDSGGTTQTVNIGEYIYTFKTKAPAGFDATATHRVAVYGSRNLTEFDLGTNYATGIFDFVPAGGKPNPRDVVRDADCNSCHDSLAFHGGSRVGVAICVMCHTPQSSDPNTGNTVDMKVFIHKIHNGKALPSVIAGTPYKIYGFNGYSDFSTVQFPSGSASIADARDCAGTCHNPKNGAAQTNAWISSPSRAACGSCHDNVNFATGDNHVSLPQVDDNQCSQCHISKGELEFDASIMGAHTIPTKSASAPGINFTIVKVANGSAGKAPTVTFTIRDNAGNGISMADMTGGLNRLALVMAGPTSDYGYTSFGAGLTTPGYVSENPVPTASCSPDGTCAYTFTHAIPANATGTFAIGIEGRRGLTILPGTQQQMATEYGGVNKVFYFSVDGTPVQPRRQVVDIAKCNGCHTSLSLHGENRNQIEMCVLCHNPSENDSAFKGSAQVPADKTSPPQSVNFALMIHKIHTGEKMTTDFGTTYTIVGFGGSHNDFTDVRYSAMGPTGTTGDTAKCYMCHVNGSEANFPIGKNPVADTQGLLNPAPATTSACTGCHQAKSTLAHANSQTDPKFGESCDVCHGTGTAYDVDKVHAGK
ncbi:MAG TPA: OmcA/MtrC family decaheme c-type cytochrome [Bryobacteraceae bacterium]|jgi:OmcA/MtrC family decaheme c-type cytochrome|nr:OmcA/MtrC family decaheme c-type cytochrome [Bryobacteraceae bacterium]